MNLYWQHINPLASDIYDVSKIIDSSIQRKPGSKKMKSMRKGVLLLRACNIVIVTIYCFQQN